jgi:signal transduction histidine kinase
MRWRIRYQLLIGPLVLLVGVLGVSVWTALASANRAHRQIETQLRDNVQTANRSTYELTDQILKLIKGYSGLDYVRTDGARHWKTLPLVPADLPEPSGAENLEGLSLGPPVTVAGTTYFCSGVRLTRGQNAGSTLYLFYPEALWREAIWEAVRPSLLLGGCAGLASIVLTIFVGQRLSRRVQELELRTRQIAAGDFSPMPLPPGDDELRDLGRSVNEMAQRLTQFQDGAQRTERLRLLGQVSGGLAHQLRNGVTGARLAVQVHAKECNGQTDAEPLHVALRQLALVETHLKRFLDLGKTSELQRASCDLIELIEEAVALLRPQCRHAGIELEWQSREGEAPAEPHGVDDFPGLAARQEPRPPEPLRVQGDAGQLGHLFVNVLTNAVEAAGPGGRVEVGLRVANRQSAIIEVSDTGPGPPPEVAARLFEPFVTGKPDGVGLGLAVAKQVAEAHGGSIQWRRDGAHTCFRIELPLAA